MREPGRFIRRGGVTATAGRCAWVVAVAWLGLLLHPGASLGTGWKEMTAGAPGFSGIWGSSGSDVFAVGSYGTILHHDGAAWAPMDAGSTAHLSDVWGSSATAVYAVGTESTGYPSRGVILRYDGSSWRPMFPGTDKAIRAVWGAGPADVFAVGSAGTILHFDGSGWAPMAGGEDFALQDVWGSSGSDVYAVGNQDLGFTTLGVILHYDGSTWSRVGVGGLGNNGNFTGVWGSSSTDVYAVGANGVIAHFDGTGWAAMPGAGKTQFSEVWGASPADVYAVGYDYVDFTLQATMLHFDGAAWSRVDLARPGFLAAVWGASATSVFAVGSEGTILRRSGAAWLTEASSPSLTGIWGPSESELFAVGFRGTILRCSGGRWSSLASGSTEHLRGVWGSSSRDVFAVGNGGTILHFDGTAWTRMPSGTTQTLWAAWGTSSRDVFAVGNGGTILHFDGTAWSALASGTTEDLHAIWGTPQRIAFAAGYRGRIQRFDGTRWYTFVSAAPGCTNYEWAFNGIWGSSATDVFFVGDEGKILHYTGNALSFEESGGSGGALLGVWGSAADRVWAVGSRETLRYDGTRWSALPGPNVEAAYVNDLWGASPTALFAVGTNRTVVRYGFTNSAPTGIALSPFYAVERQPAGTTVGTLAARDPDTGDTFTFTLAAGAGSDDNGSFRISGNQLKAGASLDFDVKRTYTVRVRVTDQGGLFAERPFTIEVIRRNDTPVFLAGPDQRVPEDAGPQTVRGWATGISPGPPDEEGQTLAFEVTNTWQYLFAAQPAVAVDGTLGFEPRPNASGSAQVTVKLRDSGGTAFGASDTSPAQTFTITILPVNDQPTFVRGPDVTVREDARATMLFWAGQAQAGAQESGQRLTFTVANDAPSLFAAQPAISASGLLSFTPAPDANGSARVTVQLSDDGGTDNGGVDRGPVETFTLTVTAVNDPPVFTKGPDQQVLEAAGPQTVSGWATGISPGPHDEGAQSVEFVVTTDNPALFAEQPWIASDGTLRYTPAARGRALVTVRARDGGGTANGGADTSAPQVFAITLTRVNSAPRFTKGADQEVLEGCGLRVVPGWATGISAGPSDDDWQTVGFVVTNDNAALFSLQPEVRSDGTLRFAPAAHASGLANVTVRLRDDGGTAFGGVDTSGGQAFVILVRTVLSVCARGCDFDDAQQALDAAQAGDRVLIAPGVWRANLAVAGAMDVVVLGGGGSPAATTLAGSGSTDGTGAGGSVLAVSAVEGETTRIRLENLTLAGGAATCGGGLSLQALAGGEIRAEAARVVIRGNSATDAGGGICARAEGGGRIAVDLENAMITGNVAGEGGGIQALSAGSDSALRLDLRNVTLGGNGGRVGSGAHLAAEDGGFVAATVLNSIISGQGPDHGGDLAVAQSGGGTATVGVSFSHVRSADDPSGACDWGEGIVAESPVFRNASAGDFRLHADSPCIDRGSSVGSPVLDFEGNRRPAGAGVDVGADEYLPARPRKLTLLSLRRGESVRGGEPYEVTWEAPAAMRLFKIYGAPGGGSRWRLLGSSRERHFTWPVPGAAVMGGRYQVRVVGYSGDNRPLGVAVSGLFRIVP